MTNPVYKDYFQIDENYFPCVNESAINAGLKWDDFYPHDTFIELLKKTERIINGLEKRSLWISGAYGTGKSYAAYALSSLLTAPSADVEAYFDKYDALKSHKTDLMAKLLAAKKEGQILTCYRYASSAINSTNDLIVVIQELLSKSISKAGLTYKGENTLKESILKWLEDDRNKTLFDAYVSKEYKDVFGGWNTDEIIEKLQKSDTSSELVGKINQMASDIGITALKTDMDCLITYIKDVINGNKLKAIVFVLDEFSEFFLNNRGRLTDFQKLVETCVEMPFYLLVVAHSMGSYFHEKDSDGRKIRDRFVSCDIQMPDNIAFDLMHNALKIKSEAESDWLLKLDDLQDFTKKSRKAVSDCTGITDNVLKGVLPLHPMSALLLKYISAAFESNQRSMFDFIKNDDDCKAFQWFIENHGPLDGTSALLTVDMLWDFFYETGRDNLTLLIRNILDTYRRVGSHNFVSEEHQVLKTILIMYAVSTHLQDKTPLFITNEQNLYLCFEGTDYEHKAPAIAEKLVREELLYKKPLGNNKFCYATAIMPGDAAELDKRRNEIIEKLRTCDLCTDEMMRAFILPLPLKMRCKVQFATQDDITQKTNLLLNNDELSTFHALICVAKDENEAALLRKTMQEKMKNLIPENKNIIYIDTTPNPFGVDAINQYAEYMAGSEIQRGKDNSAADDMLRKGKMEAGKWGHRIYNGQIIIYSHNNPEGERYINWQQATNNGLRQIVIAKYPYAELEYTQGLTEKTLQNGSQSQWVEAGITGNSGGLTASAEKIVSTARKEKYWEVDPYSILGTIKNSLDEKITRELKENSRISIVDILSFLCEEYGFIPSHLYAFITGFLLKEYANDSYRLSDDATNESMNVERLKNAINEGFKQFYAPNSRYRDQYIRTISPAEQLFCKLMSDVFEIPKSQCSSVEDAIVRVRIKAKSYGLPVWVLKEKASGIEVDFLTELVRLLNPEQGANISSISGNIGRLVESDENLTQKLRLLMRPENFDDAMKSYLSVFEDGYLLKIAQEINISNDVVISDIKRHFGSDTDSLWLWNKETGDGQINKVIKEYEFIKRSNTLLARDSKSMVDAFNAWQEKLKFTKVSYELALENPAYAKFVTAFYNVAKGSGYELIKEFYRVLVDFGDDIINFFKQGKEVFVKSCAFYLQGLSEQESTDIYKTIPNNCFLMSKQEYLQLINQLVNDYKSNLAKIQLHNLWEEKTGTDYPYNWSNQYRTPLLACVPSDKWSDYKRAFDAVNQNNPEDSEVKFALEFLQANPIWNDITNKEKIDEAFIKTILGNYKTVLSDLNEVRDYITKNTGTIPYDWDRNQDIPRLVKGLAQTKYSKEPFERVLKRIDGMDGERLKEYLKRLVRDNMTVGIEILEDSGDA